MVLGTCFFSLVGLLLAVSCLRYMMAAWFGTVQPLDYRCFGRRILLLVIGIALALMVVRTGRVPTDEVGAMQSYLTGKAQTQTARPSLWALVTGSTALLALAVFYLAGRCILHRRTAVRIQPAPVHGHPVAASWTQLIVVGSFYPLLSYVLSAVLVYIPGLGAGVFLILALFSLNNCVLVYLLTRPLVRAYWWPHVKKALAWAAQAISYCAGRRSSWGGHFRRSASEVHEISLPAPTSQRRQPTVFLVSPHSAETAVALPSALLQYQQDPNVPVNLSII
jgi:hypothetical protein